MTFMVYVWNSVVIFVAFIISMWGFYQIIGSIRCAKFRPPKWTFFTIIFWLVILGGVSVAAHLWLGYLLNAYYIGTALGFLRSLGAGKSQQDKEEAMSKQNVHKPPTLDEVIFRSSTLFAEEITPKLPDKYTFNIPYSQAFMYFSALCGQVFLSDIADERVEAACDTALMRMCRDCFNVEEIPMQAIIENCRNLQSMYRIAALASADNSNSPTSSSNFYWFNATWFLSLSENRESPQLSEASQNEVLVNYIAEQTRMFINAAAPLFSAYLKSIGMKQDA